MPYIGEVPFNRDTGAFVDDPILYEPYYSGYDWRDNYTFRDTMTFTRYMKSLIGTNGKKYRIFNYDVWNLVPRCVIVGGVIDGTWTFCKRGRKYGIKLCD